jgi:hypothetical protein
MRACVFRRKVLAFFGLCYTMLARYEGGIPLAFKPRLIRGRLPASVRDM